MALKPYNGEVVQDSGVKPYPGELKPYSGELKPLDYEPPTRNLFAKANDTMIDAANVGVGLVKAGSDLIAPGNRVSQGIESFIQSGKEKQSDWKQAADASLDRKLAGADGELDKAGIYLKHAITEDPLSTAGQLVGNLGPWAALGRLMGGAGLATRAATTMGAAGGVTAGEVRGNIHSRITETPDAELQASSPEYAALRRTMPEAQAKEQIASSFGRHAPEIIGAGAVGALGGRFGLEGMAARVAPSRGRLANAVIGVLDEGTQGATEQLASNFGVRRTLPGQSLVEDVGLNAASEGILGLGGGLVGRARVPAQEPPAAEPEQTGPAGLLPSPTSTGTPSEQILQAQAERANAVAAADARVAEIQRQRAEFEAQKMGINPADGPVSRAAMQSLESGAAQQQAEVQAMQQAAEQSQGVAQTPQQEQPATQEATGRLFPFTEAGAQRTAERWTQEQGTPFAVIPHPTIEGRFAAVPAEQAQSMAQEAPEPDLQQRIDALQSRAETFAQSAATQWPGAQPTETQAAAAESVAQAPQFDNDQTPVSAPQISAEPAPLLAIEDNDQAAQSQGAPDGRTDDAGTNAVVAAPSGAQEGDNVARGRSDLAQQPDDAAVAGVQPDAGEPVAGMPADQPVGSEDAGAAVTAETQTAADALATTPKQYHDAKLRQIAEESGATLAEVRESYDTEAGRKANEQEWVDAVKAAFRDGSEVTAKTLDKLEEVRPGAFNSFLHDHPNANVPDGYQSPQARQAERTEADARRGDRREARAERESESRENIQDIGEKIGGARKDTASPTGARRSAATTDERPAWERRFQISETVSSGPDKGKWSIYDTRKKNAFGHARRVAGPFDTREEAEATLPIAAVALKHRVLNVGRGDESRYEIWRDVTDRKRVKVIDRKFATREEALAYMADNAVAIIETNTTFGEADLPVPENKQRIGAARREGDVKGEDFQKTFGFRGVEFGNWNSQAERQEVMNEAYDGLLDLAEVMDIPPLAIGLNGDLALAFGARGHGLNSAKAHYERKKAVINLTKMNGAGALAHEWFHALDHYLGRKDGKASSVWEADADGTRSLPAEGANQDYATSGFSILDRSGVRPEVREAYDALMQTIFRKAETYVEDSSRANQFVGAAKADVQSIVDRIRTDLAQQKDPKYWKRNNKPAPAELLAEFDTLAQQIVEGFALDTQLRSVAGGKSRSILGSYRQTNDTLEQISAIYKKVRGRSGFTSEGGGILDDLRGSMNRYGQRLKMLADAQSSTEKTKRVPTEFAMEARQLDEGRSSDYWTTPHEMAARAFQGYVEDKIAAGGGRSPFLNYGPENAGIITQAGVRRPYPSGQERADINAALDRLVEVIQTRETETGVELFSIGPSETVPAREVMERVAASTATRRLTEADLRAAVTAQVPGLEKHLDAMFARGRRGEKGGIVIIDSTDPSEIERAYQSITGRRLSGSLRVQSDVGKPQAFYQSSTGLTFLIGPEVATNGNAVGVMLHEVYHSQQRERIDAAAMKLLEGRFDAPTVREQQLLSRAAARMSMAGERGNPREAAAYIIEEAAREGRLAGFKAADSKLANWIEANISKRIANLVRAFIMNVRAWGMRHGVNLGPITIDDLVGYAMAGVERAARGDVRMTGARRESVAATAERRPQTETEAFKRWFGDSKVVDAEGKPLVVYHGTDADFTAFDADRVGEKFGLDEDGFFFTSNTITASGFADPQSQFLAAGMSDPSALSRDPRSGANVMPAYLSLQNPLTLEEYTDAFATTPKREIEDEGLSLIDYFDDSRRSIIAYAKEGNNDGVLFRYKDQVFAVAFRPEQIKSATGNRGTFDPGNADINFSMAPAIPGMRQKPRTADAFADLNAEQRAYLSKVGTPPTTQRVQDWARDRFERIGTKIRQGLVDRFAALKELDERTLGKDFVETDITNSSWALARMASSASGALSAMMTAGRIRFDAKERVISMQDGELSGGLTNLLKQVGTPAEVERFFAWMAANRAEKLMAEGREHLFTAADIAAGKQLNTGKTEDGRSRAMTYAKAHAEFQKYRDDVLAIAEATGIVSAENRAMWKDEFYVPFYRVMAEDEGTAGPRAGKGLSRQEAYKKLKGGRENLNDLLENTLMNFHHLLSASLKNQAAAQAIRNAEKLGIARKVPESRRDPKTSTFVLENGQRVFYEIDDAMVFESLTALADPGLNNFAVRAMSAFKRVFTNMTTVTPQFIIANTMRDLMQATATSPTSKNVFKNLYQGVRGFRDPKTNAEMLASGGAFSFGHIWGADVDEVRASLPPTLRGAGVITDMKMIPALLRKGWSAWNDVANTSENTARTATYLQNVEQRGKLYAAYQARDIMDFSQHGAWPAVRFLIRVVPFLNARLVGLDKLYRSGLKPSILTAVGKGSASDKQAAARFATVTGALTLATIALYMANYDDEEYRELEDWQKDTYWFFRIGGNAFFLPKPFEVGAIATMAERLAEQMMDDKATGKLFRARMWEMLMQTFAFDPTPQMFQPVIDIYSNRDAFTDRPIESAGMERLSIGLRSRESTTAPAKALSAVSRAFGDESPVALSPVQADHLISGYLGSVGAHAAGIVDTMFRAATGQEAPDRRWSEVQPVRRFYRDLDLPKPYTRYSTLFYDGLREANRVYADVREMQKIGQQAEAVELMAEKRDILGLRRALNQQQSKLTEINNRIKMVQRSDKDGAWKRREIDKLNTMKSQITEVMGKRLEEVRAAE